MENVFMKYLCLLLSIVLVSCQEDQLLEKDQSSTLFYMDKPAASWYEAIPIGNGRLGGMVYGGITTDTIRTNDDTFWSGEPRNLQKTETYKCLPEIRKLLLEEKNIEAQKVIDANMLGPWNQNYMPLADILLDWPDDGKITRYRRELDLSRGVVTITYNLNGVNYKREIFASYPNQAIIMNVSADRKNAVEFVAGLGSQIKNKTRIERNQIVINGQAPWHTDPSYTGVHPPIYENDKGMRFEGRLLVLNDGGTISRINDRLHVKDAASATIIFVAATSFNGFDKDPFINGKDEKAICRNYISSLSKKKYPDLYKAHLSDYSSLFGRVSVNLGNSIESELPINQRIENYKTGKDPALTALYFQFGRYLMISGSRPGGQPLNLQGIWNQDMQPAWSANWTINCNAEINYWPAEITNLSECHSPMFCMIREASIDGAKTAKNLYNSRGWVAHHNLDIWRTTWMVGGTGAYSLFQVGGAWLCQHIWEHYLFTKDENFLRNYYDLLKSASLFYLDNLQTDCDGYLVTSPSVSFENGYIKPNGEKGWACMGSAQDMQIVRALFENTMTAAEILNDEAFKEELAKAYTKLSPMKISPRTGQLQEWNDDWEPSSPTNGQVGHGWAFAVGNQITLRETPKLAQAFRKTIEYRRPGYSYNSGSWAGTFPALYWARFEEPDSVQRVIDRHFDLALFPNLTCKFMNSWQIDGNLGFTTVIAEMLLQSHAGEINLLPALPIKYPTGSITGLRARGGYEVNIYWKDGILTKAEIKADRVKDNVRVSIRYADKLKSFELVSGQCIVVNNSLEEI